MKTLTAMALEIMCSLNKHTSSSFAQIRIYGILLLIALSFRPLAKAQSSFIISDSNQIPQSFTLRVEEDINKQRYLVVTTRVIRPVLDLSQVELENALNGSRKKQTSGITFGTSLSSEDTENLSLLIRNKTPGDFSPRQYPPIIVEKRVCNVILSPPSNASAPILTSYYLELRFQMPIANQANLDPSLVAVLCTTMFSEISNYNSNHVLGNFMSMANSSSTPNLSTLYSEIWNIPLPYSGEPTPIDPAKTPNELNFGIGLGIAHSTRPFYSYYVSSFDSTLQRQKLSNPFFTASFTLSWTPNFTFWDEASNSLYKLPARLGFCLSLNLADVNLTDNSFNPRINGGAGVVFRPRARVEFALLCDFVRWDRLNDQHMAELGKKYTIDPKNELNPNMFTKQTLPTISIKMIFRISDFTMNEFSKRNSSDTKLQ